MLIDNCLLENKRKVHNLAYAVKVTIFQYVQQNDVMMAKKLKTVQKSPRLTESFLEAEHCSRNEVEYLRGESEIR